MNSNEYVFYVFYFHHHSDNEDLQKFRLVVASDIEEIYYNIFRQTIQRRKQEIEILYDKVEISPLFLFAVPRTLLEYLQIL